MAEEISNLKDDKSVCNDSSEDEKDGAGVDCGLSLEKLNLGPRKKLLVLGLGGLLCHRSSDFQLPRGSLASDMFFFFFSFN
jgi:hypothetical protein